MADYNEIIRDIRQGKYAPIYFLHGDEPFFVDNITEHIEQNVLDESQKSFNQYVLYGKETNFTQIVSVARKYPMMGERQVVIVKEAQEISSWRSEKETELLVNYFNNPLPSTILLFAHKYKSLDKRKKASKVMLEKSVSFESKRLYDDQIPSWIQNYANARSATISTRAVHLMAENIGNNLQRLSNEIEKLLLNVPKGQEIDEKAVHKHVGISKEYNVFELQKAISLGQFSKVLKIVKYFSSNPSNHPLVVTIGSLYSYFSRLLLLHSKRAYDANTVASVLKISRRFSSEYLSALKNYNQLKVMDCIEQIHLADLHSKGIGFNMSREKEGELLKELVYKIMH
jgi:DNA polymerase-3 subunit delta